MSEVAVAIMVDLIADFVAWYFKIPLPGTGGEGRPPPDGLYVVGAVLYWWVGVIPATLIAVARGKLK
jgi:hypothetical protein